MDRRIPLNNLRKQVHIATARMEPGLVLQLAREVAHNMDVGSLDQLTAAELAELLGLLATIEAQEETRRLRRELVSA